MERKDIVLMAGVSFTAFAGGFFAGVLVAKTKIQDHYDQMMEEEIQETKRFFSELKEKEYSTPEEAAKALIGEDLHAKAEKAMTDYQGVTKSPAHILADRPEVPEAVMKLRKAAEREKTDEEKIVEWNEKQEQDRNIFTSDDPPPAEVEFNPERDPKLPLIISEDEYNENANDQEQILLMYYTGDGVLVDDHEQMVGDDEIKYTIGSLSLLRFGEMANDRNTVYIRNSVLNNDYMVLKSDGSYGEEVAGFIGGE